MKNLWSDRDAKAAIKHYAKLGVNEDLAVRTYTTRLLGGVPALVQHGGGNTSVKTRMRDILGNPVDVLCVKGSGWDMAVIEPPGLPAVRLKPLQALIDLKALTDEEMVNIQRCNLLDSASPNPSVETLFHAFLPHKFIDHTHADAVLALTDQPDGIAQAKKLFGKKLAIVEYEMPGFGLAKKAAEAFKRQPDAEGLVLEAWHLHLGRQRQAGLRPHDPLRVDGRAFPRQGPQAGFRAGQAAQADRRRRGCDADPARPDFVSDQCR